MDIRALRSTLHELSQALIFLLKYDVTGREFQTYINEDELPSRLDIERTVFTDFLSANVNYKRSADTLVQGLLDLKTRVLNHQPEDELYGFIETLLAQTVAQGIPAEPILAMSPTDSGDFANES